MVYYHLGKSNIEVDALPRIQWDQNIKAKVVKAILKATVEGPNVSSCLPWEGHQFPNFPTQMTAAKWVQAQKLDPNINQIVAWMESMKLDTVKMSDEMS